MFVAARRDDGGPRRVQAPISVARPKALITFVAGHPELRWDLQELPDPPTPTARLESIVEDLPDDDPMWWNQKRTDYLRGQMSERHAADAARMIAAPANRYATIFRRVRQGQVMAETRADGIAGCLRTPRGGSGRQILLKAGQGRFQVRLLTARECARLQGVPDNYIIDAPLNQALFGFGDAVCVPAVEWVLAHLVSRAKT
jgi:DNA (cytosine-5)-methyltransferase 1